MGIALVPGMLCPILGKEVQQKNPDMCGKVDPDTHSVLTDPLKFTKVFRVLIDKKTLVVSGRRIEIVGTVGKNSIFRFWLPSRYGGKN